MAESALAHMLAGVPGAGKGAFTAQGIGNTLWCVHNCTLLPRFFAFLFLFCFVCVCVCVFVYVCVCMYMHICMRVCMTPRHRSHAPTTA